MLLQLAGVVLEVALKQSLTDPHRSFYIKKREREKKNNPVPPGCIANHNHIQTPLCWLNQQCDKRQRSYDTVYLSMFL